MQTFKAFPTGRAVSALCCAALLTACATATAPSDPKAAAATTEAATGLVAAHVNTVGSLTAQDAGIAALAARVSNADLVSFAGGWNIHEEDARLKAALTEALVNTGRLSLILLDTPCEGAEPLNQYASAGATAAFAADVVRAAPLPEAQKSAALAETLTVLRGWNAVNPDRPVRIAGYQCPEAASADQTRAALFWGYDQTRTHTGEKDMAAEARAYGQPAAHQVWLVQTANAALGDVIPGSGWIDLRALPDDPAIRAWRGEKSGPVPAMTEGTPWSADILFRHNGTTPAAPF